MISICINDILHNQQASSNRYGFYNTTADHTYAEMGQYSAVLTIGNNIGTKTLVMNVTVEPDLQNGYLDLATVYIPSVVPLAVEMSIKNIRNLTNLEIICVIDWGDGSMQHVPIFNVTNDMFEHIYLISTSSSTKTNIQCQNHVSFMIYESDIIIFRDMISGLNVTVQNEAYATNEEAFFDVTMASGSHAKLRAYFGDGTTTEFLNSNIYTSQYIWVINHTYTTAGNYSINITAFNEHFESTAVTYELVIIQDNVPDLIITGETAIKYAPGSISIFRLAKTDYTSLAQQLFCDLYIDGVLQENDVYVGSLYTEHFFNHSFNESCIGSLIFVEITCSNIVSENIASMELKVYEQIQNISFITNKIFTLVNQEYEVLVTTEKGSDVKFNFNDGFVQSNVTHPYLYARTEDMTSFKGTYGTIGNYTATVTAYNDISTAYAYVNVVVHNHINSLSFHADTPILWPPGITTLIIKINNDQEMLSNLHCYIDYADIESEYIYINALQLDNDFRHTITLPKASIGTEQVYLQCTNYAMTYKTNTTVDVILDAVIIANVESTGWVWWTNTSKLILNIDRFGTNSCFLWNMGDGTEYIYGVPWCEQSATERGLTLTPVIPGIQQIVHTHVYGSWDTFNVTVFAFNHVSNDSAWNVTDVKEWYCYKPDLHFPDHLGISSPPFTQFMKAVYFDVELKNMSVDCMKSLNNTESILSVYVYGNESAGPVLTFYNVTGLHYEPRMLELGNYTAELTLLMAGVHRMNATARFYMQIITTPLIAQLVGM